MNSTRTQRDYGIIKTDASPYCRLRSVDLGWVRWTRGFWADRFKQCREVTIPHQWKLLADPERGHALTNLRIMAGLEEGEYAGTNWQDEWVYKWLEAVAYVYSVTRDPELDRHMDEVIAVISKAQHEDGYIASQILRHKQRFLDIRYHELYVMGHLITAACIHHRITGKRNFLDVAVKTADFLYRTFMPRDPKYAHFGYNPSYIMGLVELYRTTGDKRYLDLANVFIDMRGSQKGGSDHNQDRVPLRRETKVVGHAVLFTYLYAGATDAYIETGDRSLLEALDRLWHDLVETKMYITGGVCAIHRGLSIRNDHVHEAAGPDYYLPNSTAYNETCAQIGNMMWNWRLLAINGDAKYADVMEQTLFNSILSGIGLDGASWSYTNPLRWYGENHPLLSNDAQQRFQPGLRHICCPSNLVRTIAGLHGYVYGVSGEGLWVHHYGGSVFDGYLQGSRLHITQETDYPWSGDIALAMGEAPTTPFSLMLRIPWWANGASIKVNGEAGGVACAPGTYAAVTRTWRAGDVIELSLPMRVQLMSAHPWVEETRNQVAVMRGPIVYCLESTDLPKDIKLSEVRLPRNVVLQPRFDKDLLGGVTVLEGEAVVRPEGDWSGRLYRPLATAPARPVPVRLIPYYAWNNRGVCEMTVWLPVCD